MERSSGRIPLTFLDLERSSKELFSPGRTPITAGCDSWTFPLPLLLFPASLPGAEERDIFQRHKPFTPAQQLGSSLWAAALAFIYSIYLFIGSQAPRGWQRSAPAERPPRVPAAPGSRALPGRWRWRRRRSAARGCRARVRAGCWRWPSARWRSACSPTFGRRSCRPGCCAWKRSVGSSKWRRLFWDESTNC